MTGTKYENMKIDDLTNFQNEAPTPASQSKTQNISSEPTPEKKCPGENEKVKEIEKEYPWPVNEIR